MKHILAALLVSTISAPAFAASKDVVDQYKELGYLEAVSPIVHSIVVTVNGKAARKCNEVANLIELAKSQEVGDLVVYVRGVRSQDGSNEYLKRLDAAVTSVCENSLTKANS